MRLQAILTDWQQRRRRVCVVGVLALTCAVAGAAPAPEVAPTPAAPTAEWHSGLYLGNGGYWRQRVRVDVRNEMDRGATGEPVALRIGSGAGEADLAGAAAEAVRVCDAGGVEMLFNVIAPDGRQVARGPIPAGGTLAIPIECAAGGTAAYYVYFDNPDAWAVPDFLEASMTVRNGGVEQGAADAPTGWQHDPGDERHGVLWVEEGPHSGERCLKTVVAEGAEPTWIATRQSGIHVIGGAEYEVRAWVRAEGVKGYAGWYVHVGNSESPMLLNPMLNAGDGTYGWKEVSTTFTAPAEATTASLGTVLRGTGTAWFDDVTLECRSPSKLVAVAAKPERLGLRETGAGADWYDDDSREDVHWDYRCPVTVMNPSAESRERALVHVDLSAISSRLRGKVSEASLRVARGSEPVVCYRRDAALIFPAGLPARTVQTYYLYFSSDPRVKQAQSLDYAELLRHPGNVARNPDFELGDGLPDAWAGSAEGAGPAGSSMGLDSPGLFGRRCVRTRVPHGAEKAWIGWRQDVPVEPGRTYLYSAWVKCEDVRDGQVQIYAHYRNAAGELCETQKYASTGPEIGGTTDWTLMSGTFTVPPDAAVFQLHLTMLATGTVWHDGVLMAEALEGTPGPLESRADVPEGTLAVWPVNAIVKVFQDDVPPRGAPAARMSAARNEAEPIQLAVRSAGPLEGVRVEVEPPANARGERLTDLEVGVVGYVPIDHKTNYYQSQSPSWHRKYPTAPGACDGWPGMWPDPLLPRSDLDLRADSTQPVWVTVKVPKTAPPGDYTGRVRFVRGGRTLAEVPFTVRVWDFALPDENHMAALYDLRLGGRWSLPGKSDDQVRDQFWRFMAERRVCPDRIRPEPVLRYENGRVAADFTEYDRAAHYYFDELKLPVTYTPGVFYLFGWGHPPSARFGEEPYEGERPFAGADRSKLRPEFKRAYQACLRAYWDHMKEKGWADRCVLYISDEPWYRLPHIIEQMKALCDMIHEVDPDIPIYSSVWPHIPEWDGYLDVWGIGHYGVVPPEKMAELRAAGDRLWFTTDGHMCTDTPYCGVERLLPHYCFKYGVEAYEFWGISWLTYDPYEFGWHSYIRQSGQPGEFEWVRYPNGDGFLAYPGAPVGHDGPVSSVRLEQAREGMEDYEYLYLLRGLAERARAAGRDTANAEAALKRAAELVTIPNAGGRYSTQMLPEPDAVLEVREAVARAIEELAAG